MRSEEGLQQRCLCHTQLVARRERKQSHQEPPRSTPLQSSPACLQHRQPRKPFSCCMGQTSLTIATSMPLTEAGHAMGLAVMALVWHARDATDQRQASLAAAVKIGLSHEAGVMVQYSLGRAYGSAAERRGGSAASVSARGQRTAAACVLKAARASRGLAV